MDFNHGSELLKLCQDNHMPVSRVMKIREAELTKVSEEEVEQKMRKALAIMKNSVK